MTPRKERLTVTVDGALIDAGNEAVDEGRSASLSAWVNTALQERVARERRLAALREAVVAYEKMFGLITDEEMTEQARADRESATVVRRTAKRPASRKARGAA